MKARVERSLDVVWEPFPTETTIWVCDPMCTDGAAIHEHSALNLKLTLHEGSKGSATTYN